MAEFANMASPCYALPCKSAFPAPTRAKASLQRLLQGRVLWLSVRASKKCLHPWLRRGLREAGVPSRGSPRGGARERCSADRCSADRAPVTLARDRPALWAESNFGFVCTIGCSNGVFCPLNVTGVTVKEPEGPSALPTSQSPQHGAWHMAGSWDILADAKAEKGPRLLRALKAVTAPFWSEHS